VVGVSAQHQPRPHENGRGLRLAKEKRSLKIDGAVALSFAILAAEQSGKAMDRGERAGD